jgi:FkbM family methyltransferase
MRWEGLREALGGFLHAPAATGARRRSLAQLTVHRYLKKRKTDFELSLRGGSVFLAAETLAIDFAALREIFLARDYDTDFRDATVIDLGAHKGYFGAFALAAGAASVVSYEPERQNFVYLQRAVDSFGVTRAGDWRAHRAAIGAAEGKATLLVSPDSWAHSLQGWPEERPADEYEVDVLPADHALEEAGSMSGDRLIVKVDVEGSECAAVCATPSERWKGVDEMFVEHHRIAPCSAEQIVAHLQAADLQLRSRIVPGPVDQVLTFARA